MIQVSKTHGKRAHITNEFVRETPALNSRNTINQDIISKVCSLRTVIGAFLLTCFLSNLYVITHGSVIFRLVLKNQHRAGHTALVTSPRALRDAVAPPKVA